MELNAGQISSPEIIVGENLILSVNIPTFNHPLTVITWTQQGNMLSEADERVTISNTAVLPATSGPVTSTLQLNSVSLQDSGTFSFTAANAAGNNTLTFMVTITGKSLWLLK